MPRRGVGRPFPRSIRAGAWRRSLRGRRTAARALAVRRWPITRRPILGRRTIAAVLSRRAIAVRRSLRARRSVAIGWRAGAFIGRPAGAIAWRRTIGSGGRSAVEMPVMIMPPIVPILMMIAIDDMPEIPAGLAVIALSLSVAALEPLFVLADEFAVADVRATIAALAIAFAGRWPTFTIVFARFAQAAIVFATPAFETAIVIATPITVAATVGTPPPAEIAVAIAGPPSAIALAIARPAVPAAVMLAMPASAFMVAMTVAIPVTAVLELDFGNGIERIEHDGIRDRDAAIFVRTAGLSRKDRDRQRQSDGERHCAEKPLPDCRSFA